jgi:hypothetical protein
MREFHYVSMFSFSNSILLRSIWTHSLMDCLRKLERYWFKFGSTIRSKSFNSRIEKILNLAFKIRKDITYFTLLFHEINPSKI